MNGAERVKIRVLLVEDSPVQMQMLSFILEEAGEFEIVGTAADGVEAVERTGELRPDIVLMDCHMPRANGIEATQRIMERFPTPIVIVSASLRADDVHLTFEAIRSGALAVMSKPPAFSAPDHERQKAEMITTLRLMSEVKVVGRRIVKRPDIAIPQKTLAVSPYRMDMLAIAGSTGAPSVIADILTAIAPTLNCPVLIVQHIARGFIAGFGGWLMQKSGLTVTLPADGVPAQPRYVYLAPDDTHMGIDRDGRIRLSASEPEDGFQPSASYLFRSVAQAYGPHAMGVLLTGMGRDGASGLLEMRRAHGLTAVQDEASCVVFGMPREAIRFGAAQHVLAPPHLAALIAANAAPKTDRTAGAR
jgi:two-component system chemotaxis response regulator CheB